MKYLLLVVLAFGVSTAFSNDQTEAAWKDCNLPEWKTTCEAEFAAREAQKVIDQKNMTNQQICEKYAVCGGGSGGM